MESEQNKPAGRNQKKAWEPPQLSYVGDVEDVVQGGTGKISKISADPGEPRKTSPVPG